MSTIAPSSAIAEAHRKRLLGLAYFWVGSENGVQLQVWATWLLYAVLVDMTDAVAEVEMILATKTTPDRMEVRRVIWNRTKHRIRPVHGHPNIPHVTQTRFKLLAALTPYRISGLHPDPDPEVTLRYRRALARGNYRTIVFIRLAPDGDEDETAGEKPSERASGGKKSARGGKRG